MRASRPISTLGYATALSQANSGFPSRGLGSNKGATTTGANDGGRARSRFAPNEVLTFALSNNVGVEKLRKHFLHQ
jgi:hypothetical protein